MDIKLKKKPWYIRYKYRIAGGGVILSGVGYGIVLSFGPRRVRVDTGQIKAVVRPGPGVMGDVGVGG